MDNYKGFALFNDIADINLRNRNRGVVLSNLAADNMREGKVTPKGAALILGYFNAIPEHNRKDVQAQFVEGMRQRGFKLA